jgi:D-alanine-D-alanine ligase
MSRDSFAQKRIGVLMGGWSREREISLRSGQKVFESLKRQGFNVLAIDVARDIPQVLRKNKIEVAFIVLHGKPGEDGTIQGLLETMGIMYTGSGVLASALAIDKLISKRIFLSEGVPTPSYIPLLSEDDANPVKTRAVKELGLPLVAKPRAEGSSIGVEIIRSAEQIPSSVLKLREAFGDLLLEEYVPGMTATCGILGTGTQTKALPVLELVPKQEFYNYEAKYTKGATQFIIPARLDEEVYKSTQEIALNAHQVLGGWGFSRVDMVISPDGKPYVLELNTMPGMTELSDLPAEAEADGMSYDELVLEMLYSAQR